MLLEQDQHHWMAKRVLTSGGLGGIAPKRLTSLHVDVFTDWSAPGHAEERREHLEALFETLVEVYRTALEDGHPEAGARELVHIMANLDFWNHGWTELMEIPADELAPHYERRRAFFERHDVTPADPFGSFRPEPLPEAPATPERREAPTFPNAQPGYADDVYVEDGDGNIHVGADQPEPDDLPMERLHEFAAEMEEKYDVTPELAGDGPANLTDPSGNAE